MLRHSAGGARSPAPRGSRGPPPLHGVDDAWGRRLRRACRAKQGRPTNGAQTRSRKSRVSARRAPLSTKRGTSHRSSSATGERTSRWAPQVANTGFDTSRAASPAFVFAQAFVAEGARVAASVRKRQSRPELCARLPLLLVAQSGCLPGRADGGRPAWTPFASADLEHDLPQRAALLDQPQRVRAVLERQARAHEWADRAVADEARHDVTDRPGRVGPLDDPLRPSRADDFSVVQQQPVDLHLRDRATGEAHDDDSTTRT